MVKKYESVWNRISIIIRKKTDKQLVCFCLAEMVLNFVCKIKNEYHKYYPQNYLEKCRYEEKKPKKDTSKKKKLFLIATKVLRVITSLSNKSSSFQRNCYLNIFVPKKQKVMCQDYHKKSRHISSFLLYSFQRTNMHTSV